MVMMVMVMVMLMIVMMLMLWILAGRAVFSCCTLAAVSLAERRVERRRHI